ncbi:MAG: long-chain-acyl-CoA synthetase [Proteobacteria bacterium]|nr:long-chain-acyl-CoA synthetase [Pseudomonadota bacterium]
MGIIDLIRADVVSLVGAVRTLRWTTHIARRPKRVFPDVIEELARRFGERPALVCNHESLTYRTLSARANRYARWARAHGVRKGDVVCLIMHNRPEYLAIWLGITHAGGVVALVNTNLTGQPLLHCINVVKPRHVIVAAPLLEVLDAVRAQITGDVRVWLHGEASADLPRIDLDVAARPGEPLTAQERSPLTIEDHALYIYTSGTTGLPKAANINHYRLMLASHAFAGVMATRASDVSYNCLPMYHTVGGVVATGAVLLVGGSCVIRERFSASEFWDDIARWNCTIFHYIGELCRYLVHTPAHPSETSHRLRLACGNGLRPDIWAQFKRRFRIPLILEFYAATEGNVNLFNFEGKEGAVGRIPWFLAHRFPVKVVRFDVEKEAPVRDQRGFCVPCAPGEVGEAIGRIVKDADRPSARFEGYATAAETERKILRNVFRRNDAWFRTGDLMRRERGGYFYFVDRIGDTYRWKGENVSTSEVSEQITRYPGVLDANVYGVPVPQQEGRAGMAALVVGEGFDLAGLPAFLARELPEYAQPLFVRIRGEVEVTSTFKQKKIDLVSQGFDPAAISDKVYFNEMRARAFKSMDKVLYERICSGQTRI